MSELQSLKSPLLEYEYLILNSAIIFSQCTWHTEHLCVCASGGVRVRLCKRLTLLIIYWGKQTTYLSVGWSDCTKEMEVPSNWKPSRSDPIQSEFLFPAQLALSSDSDSDSDSSNQWNRWSWAKNVAQSIIWFGVTLPPLYSLYLLAI